MGIQRVAVEKSRAISEMVAAPVRGKFQNADAGRARPERLPTRCERRFSAFHHAANAKGAVEDVVFPRRRPVGVETAEQPALVQNSERLGASMVQRQGRWTSIASGVRRTSSTCG